MPDRQRIESQSSGQLGAVTPTGEAELHRNLSARLTDFSQNLQQRFLPGIQRAGSERAEAAGLVAGEQGRPDLRDGSGLHDDAFNTAASEAYFAGVNNDMRDKIASSAREHGNDPDLLQGAFEGLREQYVDGLEDPRLRVPVAKNFDKLSDAALRHVQDNVKARAREESKSEVLTHLQNQRDDVMNLARSGNFDDAEDTLIALTDELALHSKAEHEGGTALITPAQEAAIMSGLDADLDTHTIVGQFERDLQAGGLEAGQQFIETWDTAAAELDVEVNPEQRDKINSRLNTLLNQQRVKVNREQAQIRAQGKAAAVAALSNVEEGIRQYSLGFGLPDDWDKDLETAELALLVADDPDKLAAMQADVDLINKLNEVEFMTMSDLEKDQFINDQSSALASNFSDAGADLVEVATRIRNQQAQAFVSDSMGFAQSQGIVDSDTLPDLDGEDPVGALVARAQAAQVASEHYGKSVSPLTVPETRAWIATYAGAPAQGKAQLLATVTAGLGEQGPAFFAQVDKEGHRSLGLAGHLAQADPTAAGWMLNGQEALAAKAVAIPSDDVMRDSIRTELGTAYTENLKARATVEEGIIQTYAGLAWTEARDPSSSVTDQAVDQDLMERSVRLVTGGELWEANDRKYPAIEGATTSMAEDWVGSEEFLTDLDRAAAPEIEGSKTVREMWEDGEAWLFSAPEQGPGRFRVELMQWDGVRRHAMTDKNPAKFIELVNGKDPAGLVERGNIDIANRPDVPTEDGTGRHSILSLGIQTEKGGPEILVPKIAEDGTIMSDVEARAQFEETGRHLGKFKTPDQGTAYARFLSSMQATTNARRPLIVEFQNTKKDNRFQRRNKAQP